MANVKMWSHCNEKSTRKWDSHKTEHQTKRQSVQGWWRWWVKNKMKLLMRLHVNFAKRKSVSVSLKIVSSLTLVRKSLWWPFFETAEWCLPLAHIRLMSFHFESLCRQRIEIMAAHIWWLPQYFTSKKDEKPSNLLAHIHACHEPNWIEKNQWQNITFYNAIDSIISICIVSLHFCSLNVLSLFGGLCSILNFVRGLFVIDRLLTKSENKQKK